MKHKKSDIIIPLSESGKSYLSLPQLAEYFEKLHWKFDKELISVTHFEYYFKFTRFSHVE